MWEKRGAVAVGAANDECGVVVMIKNINFHGLLKNKKQVKQKTYTHVCVAVREVAAGELTGVRRGGDDCGRSKCCMG